MTATIEAVRAVERFIRFPPPLHGIMPANWFEGASPRRLKGHGAFPQHTAVALDGLDLVRVGQRSRARVQRRTRAQAPLPVHPHQGRRADRLREDLQGRGQAGPERRDRQGVRVQKGRVRPDDRRGLRGRPGRGPAHDRPRGLRPVRADRPDLHRAHAYLVGPQEGAERPYSLLVRAMEDSGLAGIGKFVMRNRQYLGCLHIRNEILTLEQLYFADEVDPPKTILPTKLPSVEKRELDMALRLIESFSSDWKPEKYEDTYTDALGAIVKQKRKGEEVHRVHEPEEEGPPDLLEALRLSLEQSKGGRRRTRRNGASRNGSAATKDELQEQARKLGIEGRSKMSKAQLAKAIASAK